MTNKEIAKILSETAAFLEMSGVAFKPRAYEKAALEIEALDKEADSLYRDGGIETLMQIPGIGKGIAEHIQRLIEKGTFPEYQSLKKKFPVNVSELIAIEGVGPKAVKILWEKLKIKNLADLEKAARSGAISKLPRFGKKSEEKILKGIEFLRTSGGRRILGLVIPEIRSFLEMIRSFPEVEKAEIAGSVRRRKETIGDIDILAVSRNPAETMERFIALPQIAHVYAHGEGKTLVKLKNGLDADLRIVPEKSWGAALNYFTGSKDHNLALRQLAIKKGYKLNEYGLFKGTRHVAGRTEEDLYKALGLDYIEPEMREHAGEIELAKKHSLPPLIGYGDLRGDLQIQTDWTDGEHSIEAMALEGERLGLEYIAITDHTKSLAMTGGSDEKKLRKQMAEIDKIRKRLVSSGHSIAILKGAEVNIAKDGSLDINDDTLARLDVVGAAVHSHFNLSKEEQTRRVIRAMENPHVDIIFHLTTRIIQKREPIQLDIDEIIRAAKRTGTILEIDAYPERLDIKSEYVKKCTEAGVLMSIDSDAHSTGHMRFLEMGIAEARRGWAAKKYIVNSYPLKKFLDLLSKNRK